MKDLNPRECGVELRATGDIVLRVGRQAFNVARQDARALGLALVQASSWDPAPRYHLCGAPNPGMPGDQYCKAALGHDRGHTWDEDERDRAEPARGARRWKFTE